MGLLGSDFSDPQTLAVLQLAGGLLSPGSFGQGLSRGLTGYQSALVNAQDMAAKKQAMDLQNIQMQQQKRMFDLQTPFLEEAVRRMQGAQTNGATAPPGPSAPMSQSVMFPPEMNAQRATQTQTPMAGAPAPAQGGGSMFPGVPDNVAFNMIGTGGFAKIPEVIQKYNEPTEFMKTLVAAGIDPRSAEGQAAIRANLAKSNYIAPVNARPGSILRDPFTQRPVAFNPQVPNGATPVFDASGNVAGFNEIPNAFSLLEKGSRAKTAGEGSVLPYAGVDASGKPLPVTNRTAAATQGGGPAVVTPDQQTSANAEQLRIMLDERKTAKPGPDRDALDREINRVQNAMLKKQPFSASAGASASPQGGIYAAPPLGAATGAEFQQTDLGKRYSTLRDQAAQAQTTTSYLQNIKQLATTAATGRFSDRLSLVNSLLSTANVSEKATDAVTANNLLDKYSNQIVARLGQGGLGTDAARSILQSAYPNAHMTKEAINEAADNLIGANEMTKAKMALLAPHGNAKDPVAYQQKEQVFDQNADPRLWQLKGMSPEEAQKYLSAMPPRVRADLQQRAKALKDLGAL
jgi:hypothetical protein